MELRHLENSNVRLGNFGVERVLVCVLASTRAHELTFASFKRQVLDELGADLALALAIDEKYDYSNRYWQHAKFRWTTPDFSDYGEAFDWAQGWLCRQYNVPAPDWRLMLRAKGFWQGGIRTTDPQQTASSILPFCRWLLLHGLQQDGVIDRYDRFVITRSDFVWLCPHPPLSVLDREAIWVPDGEDYGGLPDRHLVVSRADVVNCLNIIEDILLHPVQLYEEMKHRSDWWNNEKFLAHHLGRKGLLNKVKRFPYVMYTARSTYDISPTHTPGRYEPAVGHFVKYEGEYRAASAYATIIRNRAAWENGAWMRFDPASASRPISLPRGLRYTCEYVYYTILSALRRPGRGKQFIRFFGRILAVGSSGHRAK